jgi:hypothetical protein
MVEVNVIAIVLAAASTMVVGSIWYSPVGFYKQWAKLAKVKSDPDFGGKKAAFTYGSVFVASLITAYVLAYFTTVTNSYFQNSFLLDAIMTGVLAWLGFTALRMFTHDIFEGRRKMLTILNTTHELVTFLVMATIIGLLPL